MLHLDLFSGIGGFAYAADQVFGDVEHIFCDNDKFVQQVLKKHWPEAKQYNDIREITEPIEADLITGGFPCQPFSAAGVRRGTADERYLWPEMLRVIRLTHPTWVIAENVRGLLTWEQGVVFEQVCTDLEAEGYAVWPFIIPAVAVNAPHRRDRVWFVAHSTNGWKWSSESSGHSQRQQEAPVGSGNSAVTNPKRTGLERRHKPSTEHRQDQGLFFRTEDWQRDWLEVATELCRVDDGLPAELHIIGGGRIDDKVDDEKTKPKSRELEWKVLRSMWDNRKLAKTSPDLYIGRLYDIVPEMPRQERPRAWMAENETTEELCNLWQEFYAKPFEEAYDLQQELLKRIRQIERTKTVGQSGLTKAGHRKERLKSLGNAIVPQVAMEIMKGML